MRRRLLTVSALLLATSFFGLPRWAVGFSPVAPPQSEKDQTQEKTPQLKKAPAPEQRATRSLVLLADEVRHQLLMLPYYGVFDWLEGGIQPDGKVVLRGEVVKPATKSDAEARVRKIEGVRTVVNNIEVLPLSPNDERLRIALYRAIFNYNSPLFTKYALQAVPPIHIIVKNGHVTLKGIVDSDMDGQLAYTAVRGVPDIFEVTNELRVEGSAPKEKAKND